MAARPYEFIAETFDPEGIKLELCNALGISQWELTGQSPKSLASDLEMKMIQRSRLGDLLAALKELRGTHPKFNPLQYIYLFVMEHVGTPGDDRAAILANFCKDVLKLDVVRLKLTYDELLGIEGDRLMYREKALLIQDAMQDRHKELLLAIRDTCKKSNGNCKINLKAYGISDSEIFEQSRPSDPVVHNSRRVAAGITYKNFDIFITNGVDDNTYQVRVMASPQGNAGPVTVKIPPDDDPRFKSRLEFLQNLIIRAADAVTLGQGLTKLLFPGDVWTKFIACRGDLEPGEGLRVRLNLEPVELDLMPWEYCHHTDYDFIFQDRRTTLVRYPGVSLPEGELASQFPIRVLLATAVPNGYAALQVEAELNNVQKALGPLTDLGYVQIDLLLNASRQLLRQKLDAARQVARPYHVLHFVGHGDFKGEEGALALVTSESDKTASLLDASQIRALLRDSHVKFVFLNSCETAKHDGKHPMNSVARSLLVAEVVAVVAMQFVVPDTTAVLYARQLYESLAMGLPLDQTIAEVRRAAYIDTDDKTLWGIMAFFMRAPNGVFWEQSEAVAAALASYTPPTGIDRVRQWVAEVEVAYTAVKPTLNGAFTPIIDASLTQLKAELDKEAPDKAQLTSLFTALSGTMGLLGADAAPILEKITAAQTAVSDL